MRRLLRLSALVRSVLEWAAAHAAAYSCVNRASVGPKTSRWTFVPAPTGPNVTEQTPRNLQKATVKATFGGKSRMMTKDSRPD